MTRQQASVLRQHALRFLAISVVLVAAGALLASGRADALSGRAFRETEDLAALVQRADEIERDDLDRGHLATASLPAYPDGVPCEKG